VEKQAIKAILKVPGDGKKLLLKQNCIKYNQDLIQLEIITHFLKHHIILEILKVVPYHPINN